MIANASSRNRTTRQALLVHTRGLFAAPGANADRFARLTDVELANPLLSPRDRVRHTRFSAAAHGLVGEGLAALGMATRDRTGIVIASMYGGAEEIHRNWLASRGGESTGVDPVQFAKATHNYLGSVLAIAWKLRGPVCSQLGRRRAAADALWLAAALIEEGLADAMFVLAFDELGTVAQQHLNASAKPDQRFGEACALIGLSGSHCLPPDSAGQPVEALDLTVSDPAPGKLDYLSAQLAADMRGLRPHAPRPCDEVCA